MMFQLTPLFGLILVFTCMIAAPTASPTPASPDSTTFHVLQRRTDPVFPDTPPSCPICAQNYPGINSCAQAAPVLANFSMIIFNPGAFLDIIKCACTDTFQSAFPQCVDCFIKTNQSDVLNTPNLPAIVDGMRKICALESTLLGNVSGVNGDIASTTVPAPMQTSSTSGASLMFQPTASVGGALTVFFAVLGATFA